MRFMEARSVTKAIKVIRGEAGESFVKDGGLLQQILRSKPRLICELLDQVGIAASAANCGIGCCSITPATKTGASTCP